MLQRQYVGAWESLWSKKTFFVGTETWISYNRHTYDDDVLQFHTSHGNILLSIFLKKVNKVETIPSSEIKQKTGGSLHLVKNIVC